MTLRAAINLRPCVCQLHLINFAHTLRDSNCLEFCFQSATTHALAQDLQHRRRLQWWLLLQRQLQRAQQSVTDSCMCRFTLLRARRTWDDTWNSRSHARRRIWFFLVAGRTPRMLLANARRGNVPDRLRRSFGCGWRLDSYRQGMVRKKSLVLAL